MDHKMLLVVSCTEELRHFFVSAEEGVVILSGTALIVRLNERAL